MERKLGRMLSGFAQIAQTRAEPGDDFVPLSKSLELIVMSPQHPGYTVLALKE